MPPTNETHSADARNILARKGTHRRSATPPPVERHAKKDEHRNTKAFGNCVGSRGRSCAKSDVARNGINVLAASKTRETSGNCADTIGSDGWPIGGPAATFTATPTRIEPDGQRNTGWRGCARGTSLRHAQPKQKPSSPKSRDFARRTALPNKHLRFGRLGKRAQYGRQNQDN